MEQQHSFKDKYDALFNSIEQGFCTIEIKFDDAGKAVDFKFLEISPSFAQQTGIKGAAGQWMKKMLPEEEDFWVEAFGNVALTQKPLRFEHFSKTNNRWWHVYAFPFDKPEKKNVGLLFNDITERKTNEQAFRGSEEKYRKQLELEVESRTQELKESRNLAEGQKKLLQEIIDAPNLGLAVYKAVRNKEGTIIDFVHEYINKKTLETLGVDFTGKLLSDHGANGVMQLPKFIEAIETKKPVNYTENAEFGGSAHWISFSNAPLSNDRLVHIWEDVTATKVLELELFETRMNKQKEILNAIIMAQEKERHRIGEDLHDGVAQLLYALQIRLQDLSINVDEKNKKDEILKIIDLAIRDTRRLTFELVPLVLKDFGLQVALESLFQRIIPETIKYNLKISIRENFPEKIKIALYRIIQELINNSLKHAKASNISVEIIEDVKEVIATVKDNGIGFRPEELNALTSGIGLQSVKNRIELLDGNIKIESGSKGSTTIIELPFLNEKNFPKIIPKH